MATPEPVDKACTFAGRFDPELRFPGGIKALAGIIKAVSSKIDFHSRILAVPGYDDYSAATQRFLDGIENTRTPGGVRTVIVPATTGFDTPDPLVVEREIWQDRLDVMRRLAPPVEGTLEAQIAKFLQGKRANMSATGPVTISTRAPLLQ